MKVNRFGCFAILFSVLLLHSSFYNKGDAIHNTLKNNKVVGASATELLSPEKPTVVVEINYMPGYRLRSATVQNLVTFIQTYLNKPNGIRLIEKEIAPSFKKNLSVEDIARIENENRMVYNTSKQVAVYFLITNGTAIDPDAMGTAYRNTSIAIFGQAINRFTQGYSLTVKSKLESSTIEHEFGHLLGLVNLPSSSKHSQSHGDHGHCKNASCLMYYKSRSSEVAGYHKGASVLGLDKDCRNMLKMNGGK